MVHTPVMVDEVLRLLMHDTARLIVDATVGGGGHSKAMLSANDRVKIIGLDRDPNALAAASAELAPFGPRARLVESNYADIDAVLEGVGKIDGVLLDLGLSSLQIDTTNRGFSYKNDGPLAMRMDDRGRTVKELIDESTETQLAEWLRSFGEVRRASRIARAIRVAADAGELNTTYQLRDAVNSALEGQASPSLLSKIFQAFRIALNKELDHLDSFLHCVIDSSNQDARICIISYHSLEDRMVKQFFNRESRDCLCPPHTPVCVCGHQKTLEVMTKRAIKPSHEEIATNPRARSAKLRAARVL